MQEIVRPTKIKEVVSNAEVIILQENVLMLMLQQTKVEEESASTVEEIILPESVQTQRVKEIEIKVQVQSKEEVEIKEQWQEEWVSVHNIKKATCNSSIHRIGIELTIEEVNKTPCLHNK